MSHGCLHFSQVGFVICFGVGFLSSASFAAEGMRPAHAGIAAIRLQQTKTPDIEAQDFIKATQIYMTWAEIQPEKERFDWGMLHDGLDKAIALKKPTMININLPAPEWLWTEVAWIKKHPKWPGNKEPQFWDPVYIQYHTQWIQALADEIKAFREGAAVEWVLGVRVMPNGLNPENVDAGKDASDPAWTNPKAKSTWHYPAGQSAQSWRCKIPGTKKVTDDYMRTIMQAYRTSFGPLKIATGFRAAKFDAMYGIPAMNEIFADPLAMAIDTGCDAAVLEKSTYDRFPVLRRRGRTQGAVGYWEDFNESTFPRYVNPAADFYWRQLTKLDAGISYSATYGADLERYNTDAVYRMAMNFFNSYAGYHNLPEQSPGAWIAFCNGADLKDAEGNSFVDLSFFMRQSGPDGAVTRQQNQTAKAPHQEWYSAQAKGRYVFDVADEFARSLNAGVSISVTYKSEPGDNWALKCRKDAQELVTIGSIKGEDAGGWVTKTFDKTAFTPSFAGTDEDVVIEIAGDEALTVHLVEVRR